MNPSSQQDLRHVLGKFLTGVTVVSALDENDAPVGFTANSFTSVSLDPPLVLVCLGRTAGLTPIFRGTKSFAISILSADQETLSSRFASRDDNRFAEINWQRKVTGSPVIEGCVAWMDCDMHEIVDAGDHLILIGRILDAEKTERPPLGYYQGRYCSIDLPEQK